MGSRGHRMTEIITLSRQAIPKLPLICAATQWKSTLRGRYCGRDGQSSRPQYLPLKVDFHCVAAQMSGSFGIACRDRVIISVMRCPREPIHELRQQADLAP